jgi:hypothetical protein
MKRTVLLFSLLLLESSAFACSFRPEPLETHFARSKHVFRARVIETKLAILVDPKNPSERTEVIEAKFEVKEIFKGGATASGVVRDVPFMPGNCGLGLVPGMEYVFFPGEYDLVLAPDGSFGFINADGNDVRPKLEQLRALAIKDEH